MGEKNVLSRPGRFEEVKNICAFVAAGAADAGLSESDIFHIELACDEACTNIIEHAYGEENAGEIIVSWEVEKDTFVITIRDFGRPFNPKAVPAPPQPLDPQHPDFSEEALVNSLQVGGLGIHFMRKLMDDVSFDFDKDQGNTLTMVKKIE